MIWQISDIILAVSAFLTLAAIVVAIFLGLRSVREGRLAEKREFRLKLLDDITEWVLGISKYAFEKGAYEDEVQKALLLTAKDRLLWKLRNDASKFGRYDAQGEYLKKVASIFGGKLELKVKNLKTALDALISKMSEYANNPHNAELGKQQIALLGNLFISINNVIEEASKQKATELESIDI